MKFEKKLICTMENEEVAAIEKTADIMADICDAYINEAGCSECPMRKFCKRIITTDEVPYGLMYDLWRTLRDLT